MSNQSAIQSQIQYLQRMMSYVDNRLNSLTEGKNRIIAQFQAIMQSRTANFDILISQEQAKKNAFETKIAELQALLDSGSNGGSPSQGFANLVLNTHNSMMNYFKNTTGGSPGSGWDNNKNNFLVPYIPTNFNLSLMDTSNHSGNSDYKNCVLPSIGSDNFGKLTYMQIRGYFASGLESRSGGGAIISVNTNPADIINTGRYVVREITIPPQSIGQPVMVIPVTNIRTLGNVLNFQAIEALNWVVTKLTNWARQTAFLTPLPFCESYYWNPFGDPVMPPLTMNSPYNNDNLDVPQVATASLRAPSISLPNSLQRNYYDRLYTLMELRATQIPNFATYLQNYPI